ncbi:peptidoglycan-binding domain-containing protein, partial [Alkalibacillus haloalkaliphilus]|uniref:peptidoglycan-binding domain-containing protein n=1 Tax=Alkalibacillus haloalkaliphilus TaxID=94136 RepID=UPI0014785357
MFKMFKFILTIIIVMLVLPLSNVGISAEANCDDEIYEIKSDLYKLNFITSGFNDCINEEFEKVLEEFQTYYEPVELTGEIDEQTLEHIEFILSSPLKNGNYDDDTVELKEFLIMLGYGDFSKTRYYGPQTESAVKEFQRDHNLVKHGIADGPTLSKLEYEAMKPLEEG